MTVDWWADLEEEVVGCLREHGSLEPAALAAHLHIPEAAAISLVAMLAREGKVRICAVECAEAAAGRRPPARARPRPGRFERVDTRHETTPDTAARGSRPARGGA